MLTAEPRCRRCGGWRGSTSIAVRQQRVLLYPEGVVLLNDTGAAILDLCDGRRSSPTSRPRCRSAIIATSPAT